MDLAERDASVAAFRHPGDAIDGEEEGTGDTVTRLVPVLTKVFLFISRGRVAGEAHHRAWVWMHETKPELLKGETVRAYAKRVGVSVEKVEELVREFRRDVCGAHRL